MNRMIRPTARSNSSTRRICAGKSAMAKHRVRRCFQFGTLDLLILTTVVGVVGVLYRPADSLTSEAKLSTRLRRGFAHGTLGYQQALREATQEARRMALGRLWSEVEAELRREGLPIEGHENQYGSRHRALIAKEAWIGGDHTAHALFLEFERSISEPRNRIRARHPDLLLERTPAFRWNSTARMRTCSLAALIRSALRLIAACVCPRRRKQSRAIRSSRRQRSRTTSFATTAGTTGRTGSGCGSPLATRRATIDEARACTSPRPVASIPERIGRANPCGRTSWRRTRLEISCAGAVADGGRQIEHRLVFDGLADTLVRIMPPVIGAREAPEPSGEWPPARRS